MSDNWLRLLITRLADKPTGEPLRDGDLFGDRYEDWEEDEVEVAAHRADYLEKMHDPPASAVTWDELLEGRVFLVGEFEIAGERRPDGTFYDDARFRIARNQHRIERVDRLAVVKGPTQDVYAELITERDIPQPTVES